MKIALVHDWLTTYGGAERVLEALHELYAEAPIFTTIYNPKNFPKFKDADIRTSYLDSFPFSKTRHQVFIPLMPRAVEHFNLKEYDLIISDSHACAKGIIKSKDATHICYCHTPMRYVWLPGVDPRASSSLLRRWALKRLKKWDLATVDRVDKYLANSNFIKQRIKNIYNRDSFVIYPPVETDKWKPAFKEDNYFLYVGRLVYYKRPDIVIEAFNNLKLPLKVIGTGPELSKLRQRAASNIEFLGRVNDDQLNDLYSHCQALIFPTIDDFGIVPVEVMAAGRPVIAINQGGAAETVIDDKTGLHFSSQTPESIIEAVQKFQNLQFNPREIRSHAQKFDISIFIQKITSVISEAEKKLSK